VSVIRWERPPASTPGGPGKAKPLIAHELIARQLRQRPGEWALIVEGLTHASMGSLISRGKIRPYAPAGSYEAVARAVNGANNIYARYMGDMLRCQEPTCPDFGDPDFGEATCPAEHADPTAKRAAHQARLAPGETP